jgi:hypothetical protein
MAIAGADTLILRTLPESGAYAAAWDSAVAAGVMALPPSPSTAFFMIDGSRMVVEVRRGREYRASVIRPAGLELAVDRTFKSVLAAVAGICPDHTTTPYFPKYCSP